MSESVANARCYQERYGDGYVASTASVMGRVTIGNDASVWYGAVLRGDDDSISLGARSNVQDNSVVHPLENIPTVIHDDVTIGHAAIVHCREIGPRCLIGMGAILLGESVIGEESIVGAGALVKEKMVIPPRSLVVGMPARIVRAVTDAEIDVILRSAREYVEKARKHLRGP
jgi:gamma-carbonic anhydrase